jgi:hypothetical protein
MNLTLKALILCSVVMNLTLKAFILCSVVMNLTLKGLILCSFVLNLTLKALILCSVVYQSMWDLRCSRRWRSWLRYCPTSRKVAGSIPDGVIGIFY